MEVYKIQNQINKKCYIGITVAGWKTRCLKHKSDARLGGNYKLHSAIRKYGESNFDFSLLETCNSIEELRQREIYWIDLLQTTNDSFGYNMTKGGDGTWGKNHSEETKLKISEKALNCDSNRHIRMQCTNLATGEILQFKTNRDIAGFLNINEITLRSKLLRSRDSFVDEGDWRIEQLENTSIPKPKLTKRNDDQVKSHMEMMQSKSNESRKEDKAWIEKIKETKKSLGITKVVQQFKGEELIAEYNGVRDAVLKNEGFNRSGLQHCLKGRNDSYKGFTWKFKE